MRQSFATDAYAGRGPGDIWSDVSPRMQPARYATDSRPDRPTASHDHHLGARAAPLMQYPTSVTPSYFRYAATQLCRNYLDRAGVRQLMNRMTMK